MNLDHHAIEPEATPSFLLASIYLWPFFAVWSLNRPSWSGLNRDGFNRFNGIGILSLLDFLAVLALLPREALDALTKLGAVGILLGLIALHSIWLDGPRGERLKRRFMSAPARTRSAVRAISATMFGGLLIWFFVMVPPSIPHASRPPNPSCGNASEITAAACDTESGR